MRIRKLDFWTFLGLILLYGACAHVSTSLNMDKIMSKPLYKTAMGFSISDSAYASEFDTRMKGWMGCMKFQYSYTVDVNKLKETKFYFLPDVWACEYHKNYCSGEHDGNWIVLAIHDPYRSGNYPMLEHEILEVVTGVRDAEKSQYPRCIGNGGNILIHPVPDTSIGTCMKQWYGDGCLKGTVRNWKGELVD